MWCFLTLARKFFDENPVLFSGLVQELITYESEFAAVWGPGGDVDGALAAEEFCEDFDLAAAQGH